MQTYDFIPIITTTWPAMRESELERGLAQIVLGMGGVALKFVSPGNAGVPDRLVVVPGARCSACGRAGHVGLIELKAPGRRPRPLQERWLGRLGALGVPVGWADSREGVDRWLEGLVDVNPGPPRASGALGVGEGA